MGTSPRTILLEQMLASPISSQADSSHGNHPSTHYQASIHTCAASSAAMRTLHITQESLHPQSMPPARVYLYSTVGQRMTTPTCSCHSFICSTWSPLVPAAAAAAAASPQRGCLVPGCSQRCDAGLAGTVPSFSYLTAANARKSVVLVCRGRLSTCRAGGVRVGETSCHPDVRKWADAVVASWLCMCCIHLDER